MKPLILATMVAAAFATLRIDATVLISAGLPELVEEARTIVEGHVVFTEAREVPGSRSIETLVTVVAQDYLKGDLGPRVVFRVPGGQHGSRRTVMVGAPVFKRGDHVVLFLGGAGPSLPWILGLNQGVYRVRSVPPVGPGKWAHELQVSEDQPPHARSSASGSSLPLSALKARVRALLRAGGGVP
jgi:hypothetical protein